MVYSKLKERKEELILSLVVLFLIISYHFDENLLLLVSFSVLIISFFIFYNSGASRKKLTNSLRYLFTGEVATFLGFLAFLAEFLISNFLFEYTKNSTEEFNFVNLAKAVVSLTNILSVGLLFIVLYEQKLKKYVENKTKIQREPKKVLIFTLSKPSGELIKNTPRNWYPVEKLLDFHKNTLQKIYVLVSNEVKDSTQYFDSLLQKLGLEGKREYIENVDVNDEINFLKRFNEVVLDIKKSGYEDNEISIYISGGTSLATAILTLYGINDEVQIEYLIQNKDSETEIKALNIRKNDLFLFVSDLNKI